MSSWKSQPRPAGIGSARGRWGSEKLFTYAQSSGTGWVAALRFRNRLMVVDFPTPGGPKAKILKPRLGISIPMSIARVARAWLMICSSGGRSAVDSNSKRPTSHTRQRFSGASSRG